MADTTTPEIDYEQLNEQAKTLYEIAFTRGLHRGTEKGRNDSSLYHSLDKLKYVGKLAGLAQECNSPPNNDTQRVLVAIIHNILSGVGFFDAEAEIHAAMNACGATGFLPDIPKIIVNAEAAEVKLRQHQTT